MSTSSNPLSWLPLHFSTVDDPRTGNRKVHQLLEIIGLTIIAVISGADNFIAIEQFGNAKLDFLRQFFSFKNGIPSHDTIGRCFSLMESRQVESAFASWVKQVSELTEGEVIAIDGKTVRGSHDKHRDKSAIHMVSAWAAGNGLCLGQLKVANKSNEIVAIPKLLDLLDLKGCIVTIDAMGTQKEIARKIIKGKADYVLALKANHPELHEEVVQSFQHLAGSDQYPMIEEWNKDHGRIESRRCCVLDVEAADFDWILPQDLAAWTGLSSIIMIESQRWLPKGASLERRYYLSSLSLKKNNQADFNRIIRQHWSVENSLHWSLDVTFGEDQSRVRTGQADHNLSIMRRLVLNLIKKDKSLKLGIQSKRMRAAWDNAYLLKILRLGNL